MIISAAVDGKNTEVNPIHNAQSFHTHKMALFSRVFCPEVYFFFEVYRDQVYLPHAKICSFFNSCDFSGIVYTFDCLHTILDSWRICAVHSYDHVTTPFSSNWSSILYQKKAQNWKGFFLFQGTSKHPGKGTYFPCKHTSLVLHLHNVK